MTQSGPVTRKKCFFAGPKEVFEPGPGVWSLDRWRSRVRTGRIIPTVFFFGAVADPMQLKTSLCGLIKNVQMQGTRNFED